MHIHVIYIYIYTICTDAPTQELPLTQHGRRTDTPTHTHRIPATTGHARASPYAARSTHGFTRSTQYPNATYCHKATTKCRNICIIHVSADMFTW